MLAGDSTVVDVSSLVDDFGPAFWHRGGVPRLAEQLVDAGELPSLDLSSMRLGPPVTRPSMLVCVGHNYLDHVREAGAVVPAEPVIFMKAPNSVVGPNDDVLIPPGAEKTDYEVELAVVIAKRCRYLADLDAAGDAIGGYVISNDISERAAQLERGGQWVKGKSFETFNPLGPYLASPDEIDDPDDLDLELSVNGETRQRSNTSQMIFSTAYIVWYLSQFMVIEPGDVVNTGTPPGVAYGMDPPRYLRAGDRIQSSIAGLGSQIQTTVASDL